MSGSRLTCDSLHTGPTLSSKIRPHFYCRTTPSRNTATVFETYLPSSRPKLISLAIACVPVLQGHDTRRLPDASGRWCKIAHRLCSNYSARCKHSAAARRHVPWQTTSIGVTVYDVHRTVPNATAPTVPKPRSAG